MLLFSLSNIFFPMVKLFQENEKFSDQYQRCQNGIHNFGNIFRGNNIECVHRPLINMPYLTSRFE